ncbi:aromatic-ring-hydroxylating dioxygenase subunit beta (plasmid) [Prescottella equi]|uniref:aromatic-ring-hydroxylating dioxygenase subunit beta n=1 Tax=Rhodococcus hoagii TaxID=43767 RepID=UPI001318D388|nr:aromatic-ring-hydroxylating dioxygenase subunit beta [Prescottella equi]QGP74838.1 aromatic-ring-hydroxylating dioxygenase, beta subunit [Rhodococcus sp. (in: high G+C Gram-positive bacteria)]WJJ14353.1 aromatic-ring-hydroxylating dioxygenase subunit beta [Prescottella equi]
MITETANDIRAVDNLLGRYARILDEQDWEQWPDLFAQECAYTVHTLDNLQRGLPLAYMYDDNRARVLDRVKFITEVWEGTIEPYRTRHVTQRTHAEPIDETKWSVRSNFQVSFTENDSLSGLLATGFYEDVVEVAPDGARFASRAVRLDSMPTRYLVYPL